MERFLRPKRAAGDTPPSNDLAGVSQPSKSGAGSNTSAEGAGGSASQLTRPDNVSDSVPSGSGARSSTDDPGSSGSVMQAATRNVTYTDDADVEDMSCGSDAEVDEFEMPDDSHSANYAGTLEKLRLQEPEALQWLQDDASVDGASQLGVTHLRNQARKIIKFAASLNTQKKHRDGSARVLGLAKTMVKNSVAQNNKQLEEKARRVLRACYKAATTHAPKFDTLLVRLANVKEANAEAKGLYNAGRRLLDPTGKRVKLKELLGEYYSAQERKKLRRAEVTTQGFGRKMQRDAFGRTRLVFQC